MTLTIYGDHRSGNCLKVKWTAERLGLAYDWIEVDAREGETRSPPFLKLNPAGQVPTVVLDDGRALAQSNAILLHLTAGTDLIPGDPYWRSKMFEWLFWEQHDHEPYIAGARRQMMRGAAKKDLDPDLVRRGDAALARMEAWLSSYPYLVDGRFSLADISLIAYTRLAHEGGFDLTKYPAVCVWIDRVEAELGLTVPA